MSNICLDGEIEIKQAVTKDRAYWINNYIADATRFLKRLLPLIMACLLGYFYGKAHINHINVQCTTQQEYIIVSPEILPKTGAKQIGPNEILITKDICDPIKARRKLHKYLIIKKLGKR